MRVLLALLIVIQAVVLFPARAADRQAKDKAPAATPQVAAPPVPRPVQLAWPPAARPPRLLMTLPSAENTKAGRASGDPSRLLTPSGVAVDSAGRIFVADAARRVVIVYAAGTGAPSEWKGNAEHPLAGPVAVAIDRTGRVFAVDGYQARVVVFDNAGMPIADFGKGILKRPAGIAVDDSAGRIYVGDVKLGQVLSFDSTSFQLDRTIGGTPALRFDSPAELAVNSQGRLLVSDGGTCHLHLLAPDGTLIREIPIQCLKPGGFVRPPAIALDANDRIYVVPAEEGCLQIFDPEGKPLQYVPSLGEVAKTAAVRTGIAVDRDGKLYVVDQVSDVGRLQIFAQGRSTGRQAAIPEGDRRPR